MTDVRAFQQAMRWRRQAAMQHVELWVARLGERFGAEHPDVQAEIRDEALLRLWRDGAIAWQGRDTERIRQRVVSRYRLKAYGAMPDNFEEWQRQTSEIRCRLGMTVDEMPVEAAA
jgi:hypothetical protein